MIYALVSNGVVSNVITCDSSEFAASLNAINLAGLNPQPQIGWKYDGAVFTYLEPEPVFEDISPRQLRLALFQRGVTSAMIETAIKTLPAAIRDCAMIEWEYSIKFPRRNDLVDMMGLIFNWTSADLDALWHQAKTL